MCTVTKGNGNGEEASASASSAEIVKAEQTSHEPLLPVESKNEEVHVQEGAASKYPQTAVSVDGRVVSDDGPADSENPLVHEALEVSGEPSNDCNPEEEEKPSCSKDRTQATVATGSPEATRISEKSVLGFDLNVQLVCSSISISSKDALDGDEIDSNEVSSNYSSKCKISGVGLDLNESPYLADDVASYQPKLFGSSLSDNMNYDVKSKRNGSSSSQPSILTNGLSGISSDACYGVESNRNIPSSSQPPVLKNGQSGNCFMGPSTSSQTYYSFMVDSTFCERLNSTQFNMNEVASSDAGCDLISGSTTLKGLFHDEDSNDYTRLSLGLPGKRKEPEGGLELSLCAFKQHQLSL